MITFTVDGRTYKPMVGLEGPLLHRGNRVLYWDRVEGKYYDPDTDLYLSIREAEQVTR